MTWICKDAKPAAKKSSIPTVRCWPRSGGGLSNESWKVMDAAGAHVVRFGEDFPFHHVSRANEVMAARAASGSRHKVRWSTSANRGFAPTRRMPSPPCSMRPASLTPRGSDVDYFCFDATAGDRYFITTETWINVDGELPPGVYAKDVILHIIKLLGAKEALEAGVQRVVIGDARGANPIRRALDGEGTVIS